MSLRLLSFFQGLETFRPNSPRNGRGAKAGWKPAIRTAGFQPAFGITRVGAFCVFPRFGKLDLGSVGLDLDVGGGLTATGEDFAVADIAQWAAVGILDLSLEKIDPAGSTKSLAAMAIHFHAVSFQKTEDVGVLAFGDVEGLREVVDLNLVWHIYPIIRQLKWLFVYSCGDCATAIFF